MVVPVGLEAAEQHDVIVGPLAGRGGGGGPSPQGEGPPLSSNEGLVAVVLPAGGRPADQLVVVLAGPGELAVRAAEHRVLPLTPASAASLIASRC